MKKQKLNYRTTRFVCLLLIAVFIANIHSATAQKEPTENKLLKYELSIDLVPIIDQGQFGKVYFKLNRYKEDQLKGAYRLGFSRGSYSSSKLDRTNVPQNVNFSNSKFSNFEVGLFIGYEKYKMIGSVMTYYGIDLVSWYFERQYTPHYVDDQRSMTLGICPFWGIKHFIYKNRVSLAFEVGWENSLNRIKSLNPSDGSVSNSFNSDFKLPYNFTLNYQF